jgi:hypothetical protein
VRALLQPAFLRPASYVHSVVYLALLWAAFTDREEAVSVLGWIHGPGWIVMALLCLAAVRARTIPLWLGVMVAVVGGVGPFAGSIGFWLLKRQGPSQRRPSTDPQRNRG